MLKLITLNAWGGRVPKLLDFLRTNNDIDIFCFQEIYSSPPNYLDQGGLETNVEIYSDINKMLPNHAGYFRSQYEDNFGLATFINKTLRVVREAEIYVYGEKGYKSDSQVADHGRNLQSLSLDIGGKELHIFNVHGLWTGINKSDNEDRIEQSKRINEYMTQFNGGKVLCGDFNLLPDTKSIHMIEDSGMRNLVTESKITSTRTSYYDKNIPFADYVFINDKIDVLDFEAVEEEISDHKALKLEFELR